jgi:threonylcarbamoyladenosine tRNA methylthiotransferase MtaB
MRSKPVSQVLSETKALLENGYQEIVLTGIRLGLYMDDSQKNERVNLFALLKKLIDIPGHFRIRLSSLEVTEVSEAIISLISTTSKICRHFHIPMQSGSTAVLKAMARWYDGDFYESRVRAVREKLPDCGVTADVMVGYPTETEDQFWETFHRIERMQLSGLHVFRFSARETTPAAELTPLDPQIIIKRAKLLGELDDKLRQSFFRRFEGSVREVVPEPTGEGWTDNYIRVKVPLSEVGRGLSLYPVS